MTKRPKKTREVTQLGYADGTVEEIAGSIRDLALDQMQVTLEGLGVPAAEIAAARKECIKVGNDRPFATLGMKYMRRIPGFE